MSTELFTENQNDIEALISDIDRVIYQDDFLAQNINYKLNVVSVKMKALIIQHGIDIIAPRGDFYERYQVEWPSPFFKTHYAITQAVAQLREKFNGLETETEAALKKAAAELNHQALIEAKAKFEKEMADEKTNPKKPENDNAKNK